MNIKNNMLIILDGLGLGRNYEGNAFFLAHTPNIDRLFEDYPMTQIVAVLVCLQDKWAIQR